jgi:hypothetical protein
MPLFVGSLGESDHHGVVPGQDCGGDGDRAEGVAEDVPDELTEPSLLNGGRVIEVAGSPRTETEARELDYLPIR